jgi:chromosome segregation ATPase
MAKASNITIEILKQIRDGVSATNERLDQTNQRLDTVVHRLEGVEQASIETNQRLGAVEGTLLDLAQQQRFVTRGLRVLANRDHRLEGELDELRTRVEAIEKRLP